MAAETGSYEDRHLDCPRDSAGLPEFGDLPSSPDRVERFSYRAPRCGCPGKFVGGSVGEWVRSEDHDRALLAAEGERDKRIRERDGYVAGKLRERARAETAEKHLVEVRGELERRAVNCAADAEGQHGDERDVPEGEAHAYREAVALLDATPSKDDRASTQGGDASERGRRSGISTPRVTGGGLEPDGGSAPEASREQAEAVTAKLRDSLDVWAGWIESGKPIEDTNRQLMALDIRRAMASLPDSLLERLKSDELVAAVFRDRTGLFNGERVDLESQRAMEIRLVLRSAAGFLPLIAAPTQPAVSAPEESGDEDCSPVEGGCQKPNGCERNWWPDHCQCPSGEGARVHAPEPPEMVERNERSAAAEANRRVAEVEERLRFACDRLRVLEGQTDDPGTTMKQPAPSIESRSDDVDASAASGRDRASTEHGSPRSGQPGTEGGTGDRADSASARSRAASPDGLASSGQPAPSGEWPSELTVYKRKGFAGKPTLDRPGTGRSFAFDFSDFEACVYVPAETEGEQ